MERFLITESPIGPQLHNRIASWGHHGIRADIYLDQDDVQLATQIEDLRERRSVLIIGGWNSVESKGKERYRYEDVSSDRIYKETRRVLELAELDAANRWWLECGNEPNITDPVSQNVEKFRDRCAAMWQAIQDAGTGHRMITGGVSNLDKGGGHAYLVELLRGLPPQIVGGLHPYRTHARPEAKFDEWNRINDAVWELRQAHPDRQWAVTEIGWHTATQERGWGPFKKEWSFTDDEVAEFYTWEHDFWAREGALVFCWYQLNDGPEDTPMHRYGVRTLDDNDKPVTVASRRYREVRA